MSLEQAAIGFIGLGAMEGDIARRLAQAGASSLQAIWPRPLRHW